jgi:hypothetical protein
MQRLGLGVRSVGAPTRPPSLRITELPVSVAASDDDAREVISSTNVSITVSAPVFNTTDLHGLRFQNITIPAGAVIIDAFVQFTAAATNAGAHTNTISGEAADNAAAFVASNTNVSARADTTATVSWSIPDWTSDDRTAAQKSPDIKTIIKAIVDRAGWVSGNSLVIFMQRTGGASNRSYAAWDHATLEEPTLTVRYLQ